MLAEVDVGKAPFAHELDESIVTKLLSDAVRHTIQPFSLLQRAISPRLGCMVTYPLT